MYKETHMSNILGNFDLLEVLKIVRWGKSAVKKPSLTVRSSENFSFPRYEWHGRARETKGNRYRGQVSAKLGPTPSVLLSDREKTEVGDLEVTIDIIYAQGQKGKTLMWYRRAERFLQHRAQRLQEV